MGDEEVLSCGDCCTQPDEAAVEAPDQNEQAAENQVEQVEQAEQVETPEGECQPTETENQESEPLA